MEGRHQRRTLSARRHVPAPEVCGHGDPGEFGQQGGVADLDGKAVFGAMPDGLAVASDRANVPRVRAGAHEHQVDCVGILAGEDPANTARSVDFVESGRIQGEQGLAQPRVVIRVGMGHDLEGTLRKVHKDGVDPVQAGARHQAYIEVPVRHGGRGVYSSRARLLFAIRSSWEASGEAWRRKAGISAAATGRAAGIAIASGLRGSPAMRNS